MFDHNSIMALKQLVAGEEEETEIVQNAYKGSMLDPGTIGNNSDNKKQTAKPNAKMEVKMGEKFIPKKQKQIQIQTKLKKINKIKDKYVIWNEQQVAELPILKNDPRKQPNFQTMYRQKVGTEDVFLGLSGIDPSSNNCQQMIYKIQLPNTVMKNIQIDLNSTQMVIQTPNYYLSQHFQYQTDCKKSTAKFHADKSILELYLPIIRENDL